MSSLKFTSVAEENSVGKDVFNLKNNVDFIFFFNAKKSHFATVVIRD